MNKRRNLNAALALLILLAACGTQQVWAQQSAKNGAKSNGPATFDFTVAKPESVGFSSERLERLHALMQQNPTIKSIPRDRHDSSPARQGRGLPHVRSKRHGERRGDSTRHYFRAFSVTKPITGVAMMMLLKRGNGCQAIRFRNISLNLHTWRLKSVDAAGNMILDDAVHAPTMRELMTHPRGLHLRLLRQQSGG